MRPPVDLLVTLVTGIRGSGSTAVARELSRRDPAMADPGRGEQTCDADDTATLAERLAADLDEQVERGLRGHVVVEVDHEADPQEFALVLESWLPASVALSDVVAAVDLAALRRALRLDQATGTSSAAGPNAATGTDEPTGTNAATSTDAAADADELDRLVTGVESASVLAVGGLGALTDRAVRETFAVLRALAPVARIATPSALRHRRPVARPGLASALAAHAGWMLALDGGRASSAHPLVVESIARHADGAADRVVVTDPRPFHPARLAEAVARLTPDRVGTIVRSRGLVRLATRPGRVGSWSSIGDLLSLDPTAMDGSDPEEPIGQELCFIGIGLDAAGIEATLGAALLTDDELLAGPAAWAGYDDPLPQWGDRRPSATG